jgi:hypothetical protein
MPVVREIRKKLSRIFAFGGIRRCRHSSLGKILPRSHAFCAKLRLCVNQDPEITRIVGIHSSDCNHLAAEARSSAHAAHGVARGSRSSAHGARRSVREARRSAHGGLGARRTGLAAWHVGLRARRTELAARRVRLGARRLELRARHVELRARCARL